MQAHIGRARGRNDRHRCTILTPAAYLALSLVALFIGLLPWFLAAILAITYSVLLLLAVVYRDVPNEKEV